MKRYHQKNIKVNYVPQKELILILFLQIIPFFFQMSENTIPKSISSHHAVMNLLKYSQSNENLLQKYTLPFFLNYFDRQTIEELEQKMGKKPYSKLQFIKELTSFILHCRNQTLFLVLGLIQIYVKISREANKQEIRVKDFTQFLCTGIANHKCQFKLQTKEMPIQDLKYNPKQIRDIDINAAIVYSCSQKQSPQISKNIKKKEKRVDKSKPLYVFKINRKTKEILTLGRLASQISIFSLQLQKQKDISPNCLQSFNLKGTITSMAFSEKQQRIGCLVTHVGMVFWDYQDDFNTEKVIRNIVGERIQFLEVLVEWITITTNSIYTWDLKREKIKNSLTEPNAITINGIEEISHLRCLAISFTMKDKKKQVIVYKNEGLKIASKMKMGHVGCQKLHYHKSTQTLLIFGDKELQVYQIDQISLDLSLVSELKGHETMMTCIADLSDGFIATGDDRGTLRIWDLNSFRCQQVLKVSNTLDELALIDRTIIFGDSRLNTIQLQPTKQKQSLQSQFGLYKFYNLDSQAPQIFIFTSGSCRVYSLFNGRINRVIELCTSEEQIIAVQQITDGFLISTSRGYLYYYQKDFKLKWKIKNNQFSEEIIHIRADRSNKLFTTIGKEGNLYVWSEQTLFQEGSRKSIINSDKKGNLDIRVFDLSEKYGVMISGDKSSHLNVWDYQSCKLCHIVELEAPPCALKIGEKYPLLAFGCLNERIYLYTMSRKENLFEVTFLQYGNLRYPELKLNSLLSVDSVSQMTLSPRRKPLEGKTIVSQHIIFFHREGKSLMGITYGRGNILTYDISPLQSKFSSDKNFTRRAVNIQRPVKQTFEKQISKNQYRKTEKVRQEQLSSYHKLKVAWNRKLHQDTITHLDVCQNRYFSTISLDGSYKIISVEKGEIVGFLELKNPLPSLWKVQFTQEQQICKKVHEALTLINQIIHDKETTQEQRRIFDICPLMKQICTKNINSAFRKKRRSVKILKQEIENQEKNRVTQQSLKSMEAFRRVSLIREEIGKTKGFNDNGSKKIITLNDKKEMMKLFSPFHFPNRIPPKWFKQQWLKFNEKVAKSAHVSPTYSPQKVEQLKQSFKKPILLQTLNRKPLNYHLSRSISQKLQKLDHLLTSPIECKKSRKSESIHEDYSLMSTYEPIKGISNFIKDLNKKVPKDVKYQKHLKKKSGIVPKF